MTRNQSMGFTLVELVLALVIVSVVLSITVNKIGGTRSLLAGNAARQAFMSLHARTRAQAIEFGTTARLMLDTAGDSAWIVQGGRTIETYRFAPDGVDVESPESNPTVQICMIPRGYSEPRCNSFTESLELTFTASQSAASLVVLPMGQLKW